MAGLIRRGQLVVVAIQGDFGKPRPALIIQSDLFSALATVLVSPLTTTFRHNADEFRLEIRPAPINGLQQVSYVAIDKTTVVSQGKVGAVIGGVDDAFLLRVNRALALFAGLI